MTKKRKSLHIQDDLSSLIEKSFQRQNDSEKITIKKALKTVIYEMKEQGYRQRTLDDYYTHVSHLIEITDAKYLDELDEDSIYTWLSSMNVSNQTKLTRLKCVKAFLNKCFNKQWFKVKFWQHINIKVDKKVKEGATQQDVYKLLRALDLTKFVELRDAVAVLTMFQTGVRISTLAQLENKHLDVPNLLLKIDGAIIKNHQSIHLPISEELAKLFTVLKNQNDLLRKDYGKINDNLFLTHRGDPVATGQSNNLIQKRLNKYMNDFNLKNLNAHALRRGFAKNLLNKNAKIPLISKALGHSDISVTTQYLHLDLKEVSESLRDYL